MLMMAPPIFEAVEHVLAKTAEQVDAPESAEANEPAPELRKRVIFLGPTGSTFNQAKAENWRLTTSWCLFAVIMKASIIA